jgi:peroxiredoxin family protein
MAEEQKKKVSMVVFSGDMDKLFAAFIIATGAAAAGFEVTMFFTFWGLKALQKKGVSTGKSFFGRMLGWINGGDITKANPSRYGFGGMGRWMFGKMMKAKNAASLPELRQLAIDLGVKMYPCQMTMEVLEYEREKFIPEITDCVGVGFFIEQASQSAFTMFI